MNHRNPLRKLTIIALISGVVVFSAAAFAGKLDGARYLKDAKVTLKQARVIALKKEHGHIVSQELEKEHGGSGLRYSFDIKVGAAVHEVGVDARTGKVLEDSVEGPDSD